MSQVNRPRAGFTLVELIIVMAIVSLLAALILGAVQVSRASARRLQCQNNLRQIGLAMQVHHDNLEHFPSGWSAPEGWAWGALILPYMESAGLYENLNVRYHPVYYNMTTPPDAGEEGDVSLSFYLCPADGSIKRNPNYTSGGGVGYMKSNYVASHGDTRFITHMVNKHTGIFGLASQVRIPQITDGTSNTFLVGERRMSTKGIPSKGARFPGAIWIRCINKGGTYMLGSSVAGLVGGTRSDHRRAVPKLNTEQANYWGFSSMHRKGANFVFADASVHFIYDQIDYQVYRNMANIDDGNDMSIYVARGF